MTSILGGSSAAVGLMPGPAPEPSTEPGSDETGTPTFLETSTEPEPNDTARRLVIRLVGGEELELGNFDDRGDAVEAAQELVGRFSTAEVSGDWPEIDGRFLRPASVTSIDVLIKN